MAAEKIYDAVFVGSSLISLAAAAVLAKRGKSVLFFDAADSKQDLPSSVFHFTLGPLLSLGFEEGGAMEGFFSELSLPIPNLKKKGFLFRKVDPLLQVVQSRHRVNLSLQRDDCIDDIKREFGGQVQQVKAFLDLIEKEHALFYSHIGRFSQIEIQGFGDRLTAWREKHHFLRSMRLQEKKSATSFLSPFSFDRDFLEFLSLQTRLAFGKNISDVSAYQLITLIAGLQKGGVRVIGGSPSLVEFFLKLIREWGGEVVQGKNILKVETERKKATGVVLQEGLSYQGRHLVVVESPTRGAARFYFTLRNEWIPAPMKENLIMTWGESVPEGAEDIVIVRLSLAEEEANFPPGVRGLSVTCPLLPGKGLADIRVDLLKTALLERLSWLIPFSRSKLQEAIRESGQNNLPLFPDSLEREWVENSKEVSNGILRYLRPRKTDNVFLIQNDLSGQIGWGSHFLSAMALAETIGRSR